MVLGNTWDQEHFANFMGEAREDGCIKRYEHRFLENGGINGHGGTL